MSVRTPTDGERARKRALGEFLSPSAFAEEHLLPELLPLLRRYKWVDLFAGEGNLVFPLLERIPTKERADFFARHIALYDVQEEMVERCVQKAVSLGVPEEVARRNIKKRDTLAEYPEEIFDTLPVYHVTNPPYLHLGRAAEAPETRPHLARFQGGNRGYQDLYQLALANDVRRGVPRMAYVLPTNFLFGDSGADRIRREALREYWLEKVYIFEKPVFQDTGVGVLLAFFARKERPEEEAQEVEALWVEEGGVDRRKLLLHPRWGYRAGAEFQEFVEEFRAENPPKVSYYLTLEEVEARKGPFPLRLLDVNAPSRKGGPRILEVGVDRELHGRVKGNPLFLRTLDTGSWEGRAGLYSVPEVFGVDGLVVTKAPYRTHPVQVFLDPPLSREASFLLAKYFNLVLERFRSLSHSGFMTTFKYSNGPYTRKYLGLTQARSLVETFPYQDLPPKARHAFRALVLSGDAEGVIRFLREVKGGGSQKAKGRE